MKRIFALAVVSMALGTACHAAPAVPRAPARSEYNPAKDKVLYEVGYSHLDTQWRWTYEDTIGRMIPNTMTQNFALFEKYPDYRFTFSGASRYRMMKEYYPKDYARVKGYIQQGRWFVGGSSWEENDVNVPSSESIIRQFLYGNGYFKKEFGKQSIDFMLPDCFGFPASLPSLLAHSGIKGFSTQKLTWGSAVGIPFSVGRWYGPDGKFVTAALDAGSYNSRINEDLSESNYILDRINKTGNQSGAFVDFRYYGVGDEGGAPTEGSVQWLETGLKGKGPVTVVSSPSDQIFRDLTPEQISKLPQYTGDLLLTEHSAGSITSQAYVKRWNRKNELLADSAERAGITADWLGAQAYPYTPIRDAWDLLMLTQFHDILPGTSVPKAYEYSWNDDVVALNRSAGALSDSAGAVIRGMDTRVKGVALVVYNPLATARQDIVEAVVRMPKATKYVRVYGPDGVEVPSQVLSGSGAYIRVLFLAKAPSVGFTTYDVRPSNTAYKAPTGLRVTKNSLENSRYLVTLNENGDVAQIKDKAAGRNLLSAPARLAFKHDEPDQWPAWNIDWEDQKEPPTGYVSGPATVRIVENGPVRVALEVTRNSRGSKFVQVVRLGAAGAGNRVEFDNNIDWNTLKTTLKTEFTMAVANDKASYNMGMGVAERATNDPKKYEVPHHQWFDLTDRDGKYGVSVLEDCKYASDKPDDRTLRLTLIRTPGARSYQDQATQDIGRHRVLYALMGHEGSWRGKTPWEAARLNQPLIAFQAPAHAGRLGKSFSLLKVNNAQVAVTAIKQAEGGKDIVVRLQELSGSPANVTLTAAAAITSAREVNGQEETIGEAALKNGSLVTTIPGYSARAFALRLAPSAARVSAPVAKSVTLKYDVEAAGPDGKVSAKGFDGKGRMFPAELFPQTVTSAGVPFRLAKAGPGAKTALACNGQKVALPGGNYTRVYVLASSINGDTTGTFVAGKKAVPVSVQDWSGYVGQWYNRIWQKPANNPGLQRLEGGIYGLQPAFIKRDPIAFYTTHRHDAKGANGIYEYAYAFRYAFDVPAGTKTLTLPKNPAIRVFAITAVSNPNDTATPAQPLYDTFDTAGTAPTLSPAGGTFKETTSVVLKPSVFNSDAQVRYTVDGTVPTATSPLFSAPIRLTKDTVIRARAFKGAKQAGPVVTGTFKVDDQTAPKVTGVVAAAGSPLVRVSFSEPVEAASAAATANWKIDGLTVSSAKVSADAGSNCVDLVVQPAPVSGRTYSMAVNGIRDVSPRSNKLETGKALTFTAAAPVFALIPDLENTRGKVDDLALRTLGQPALTKGPAAGALTFNGREDGIVLNNRPELNPTDAMTLSAWIRPTSWDGNKRIMQKGREDNQFRLTASEGKFLFELSGVGSVECPLPALNTWHHVAAVYDGASMRLYLNGKLAGRTEASGKMVTSEDPLYIGTKNARATSRDYFAGDMFDVRLYDAALLPEHITAMARP